MYQCHDVGSLDHKSERAQYGKGQMGKEDGKDKRDGENREGERDGRGYLRNKVDPMVDESSNTEISDYDHIIYRY